VNEAIGSNTGKERRSTAFMTLKDGRIRAHAESQRQNRRDGKARALAQGAEGEAEIAEGLVEEGPAVVEIEALLRYADVAELAAGLTAGFFIAETFALSSSASSSRCDLISSAKSCWLRLRLKHDQASSGWAKNCYRESGPWRAPGVATRWFFSTKLLAAFGVRVVEAGFAIVLADAPLGGDPILVFKALEGQ